MITEWSDFLGEAASRKRFLQSIMTIGSFDGVHQGHKYLIGQVVERAQNLGVESVVVTFDPLPAEVIMPGRAPKKLTDIHERIDLLEKLGADHCVVLQFSEEVARLQAHEFLRRAISTYGVRELWVGADFAFGHKRQGDVGFLVRSTNDLGFDLHVVARQALNGLPVSSTEIRSLVGEGKVDRAATLLGHPPVVSGTVIAGAGRGKDLGYPTANLHVDANHLVPASGIYAGFAVLGSERIPAAISIGYNPTFGTNPLSIEAFLLDFSRDLRGDRVTLEFVHRLRSEESFDTVEDLVAQMDRDVARARRILLYGDGITSSHEARVEASGKNV